MSHNWLLWLFILVFRWPLIWPMGTLNEFLCYIDWLPLFFEHKMWQNKMFRAHLVFFQTQHWNLPFLQRMPGSFQWQKVFENQDLDVKGFHCSQSIIASITMQYYICSCVYLNILLATFISKLWFHMNSSNSSPVPYIILTLPLSIFVLLSSNSEIASAHYPQYINLFS